MASQSTSTTTNKGQKPSGGAARQGGRGAAPAGGAPSSTSSSGTPETNETYGLVSVLYHALQGAETYTQYVNDARKSGDEELVEFFEECRDELNEQALRARQLLATRLEDDIDEDSDEEDDDEDDEDDEEE